jgi:hypothetical protein
VVLRRVLAGLVFDGRLQGLPGELGEQGDERALFAYGGKVVRLEAAHHVCAMSQKRL